MAAAVHLVRHPPAPPQLCDFPKHPAAARVLAEFGLVPSSEGQVCGITRSFERLLGKKMSSIDWRAIFGQHYRHVEQHVVWCRALADTNITAWANAMDVFNDWLLFVLYEHDPSLGTYQRGSVGSVLDSRGRLNRKYPAIYALVQSMHSKRGESSLSHAWVKKGKRWVRPTGFVKHSYVRIAKKLIEKAVAELAKTW